MTTRIFLSFIFLAFFAIDMATAQDAIPGQYIVVMRETDETKPIVKTPKRTANREQKAQMSANARSANIAKTKTVRVKQGVSDDKVVAEYADVMVGFCAKLTPQEVNKLKADTDVQGVYPDYVIALGPTDPEPNPSELTPKPSSGIVASGLIPTCAVSQAGGSVNGSNKATWIWILDTGIDLDHPELNVQTSPTFAKSFISGQSAEDGNGHGTHVAGIAAAKNVHWFYTIGVSAGARVVPVKVLSNAGSGSWSALLSGLNHVAQYDIPGDVVNMSLGAYGINNCENSNPVIRDAIRALGNAGTHVVMAAGNDNGDANRNFPGCVNGTRVYTVGSMTCSRTCSGFSNFATSVDWVAVGSGVYSTYKNGGYATLSGTSMAAPVVAGIIHARGGAPASAGNITCKGRSYKIAKR